MNPYACPTLADLLELYPALGTFGQAASGSLTLAAPAPPGALLTIGSAQLQGVAGPRTPGGNNWSTDGTVLEQADSIVSAISDPANSMGFLVAHVPTPGLARVELTTLATGPAANLPWSTTAPVELVLDGPLSMTGGDAELLAILSVACSMISLEAWGSKANMGGAYLAAHIATMAGAKGMGGEGGPATSRSLGGLSTSYATIAGDTSSAAFNSRAGRMYIMLRDSLLILPIVGTGLPRGYW